MNYIYASGAIKAKSVSLFKEKEYLTLQKTTKEDYLKQLRDLGYGFDHIATSLDEIIENELLKTKKDLLSILEEDEIIYLWFLKYDLVNIKLILKNHLFKLGQKLEFEKVGSISIDSIKEALINNNFDNVRKEDTLILKKIKNGLKKDLNALELSVLVDNLVNTYIKERLESLKDEVFLKYFTEKINILNLLTVIRLKVIGEDENLLIKLFNQGGSIDLDVFKSLIDLPLDNQFVNIVEGYYSSEVVEAMKEYFESDNLSTLSLKLQELSSKVIEVDDFDTFKSGPLINYLVDKEREVRNVRRLYFDKKAPLPELTKV